MARTEKANSASKPRHQEVLDAAAKIFHTRGYASSSVQVIADELGILKGSIYYYISSKEDLLYQLLEEVHVELGVILADAQADTTGSPLDRLSVYVQRQVQYAAENIPKIAIYYHDSDQLSAQHLKSINAQRREHEVFVKELIIEGQSEGLVVPDEDPRVLANLLFGTLIWTYRWYDPKRGQDAKSLGESTAAFVRRALEPHAS